MRPVSVGASWSAQLRNVPVRLSIVQNSAGIAMLRRIGFGRRQDTKKKTWLGATSSVQEAQIKTTKVDMQASCGLM
jgi:hypothetical protein